MSTDKQTFWLPDGTIVTLSDDETHFETPPDVSAVLDFPLAADFTGSGLENTEGLVK